MLFGGRDRESGNVLSSLALILLGPLAAGVIQMAISRNREYAADATGAQITGDPLALASALRKLELGTQARPPAGRRCAASRAGPRRTPCSG